MPILKQDPGSSPEAPGTLYFYEQGKDPATGFQVSSSGQITAPGGQAVAGDMEVDGALDVGGAVTLVDNLEVGGYTELAAGQANGQFTLWSGTIGALRFGTAGGGISVKEGAGAAMGVATLVAGTVTVANTKVTANSRIFLTPQNTGGTPGAVRVASRVAGTSFTVTSTSGTDTSQVAWFIVEPSA